MLQTIHSITDFDVLNTSFCNEIFYENFDCYSTFKHTSFWKTQGSTKMIQCKLYKMTSAVHVPNFLKSFFWLTFDQNLVHSKWKKLRIYSNVYDPYDANWQMGIFLLWAINREVEGPCIGISLVELWIEEEERACMQIRVLVE